MECGRTADTYEEELIYVSKNGVDRHVCIQAGWLGLHHIDAAS